MKLKGALTITRSTGGGKPDEIRLRLRCESSRIDFAEVTISLAEFAQAVTGLGYRPVEIEVRGLEHVGMEHERMHKAVHVGEIPWANDAREEFVTKLAAANTPTGWTWDSHATLQARGGIERVGQGHAVNLWFHRYVPRSGGSS